MKQKMNYGRLSYCNCVNRGRINCRTKLVRYIDALETNLNMKSLGRLIIGILGLAGLGGSLILFSKYESERDLEKLTTLTKQSDNLQYRPTQNVTHEQE